MKNRLFKSNSFCALALAAGLLVSVPALCHAQAAADANTVTPTGGGRLYVELRDATLADALEMIFKASGNPSHIIDESAKYTTIPFQTWENKEWGEIVRVLANLYNFKFYRDSQSGTYIIEPRVVPQPIAPQFGGPGFNSPFGAPAGTTPGGASPFGSPAPVGAPPSTGLPRNPFQAGAAPMNRPTQAGQLPATGGNPNVFKSNRQTLPSLGRPATPAATGVFGATPSPFGAPTPFVTPTQPTTVPTSPFGTAPTTPTRPTTGGGTTAGTSRTGKNGEPKEYHILTVKHIYAGAITTVFSGGTIIPTEDLVNMGSEDGGNTGNNRTGNNRSGRGGRSGFGNISGGRNNNRFGSIGSAGLDGSRLARSGDLDVYGLGF